MKQQYLEAGKITNTHGVRGEVRITPWADSAAFLRGFRTFYIDGQPVRVLRSRVHKNQLIAQLEGYDDVNAAMTLKNKVIHIDRADAKLPEGRYFLQDLLGMRVVSDAGEALGELADVLDCDIVWVKRGARR